jgi:hypothetical protein
LIKGEILNCPNDNVEMEKWESWGDYIQYRCPKCGFKTDNREERAKMQAQSKANIFDWALKRLVLL